MTDELFNERIVAPEIENGMEIPQVKSTQNQESQIEEFADDEPIDETMIDTPPVMLNTSPPEALLSIEDSVNFRTRWEEIQGKFVDDPRNAVQQADMLVSEVIDQLTLLFTTSHASLEDVWKLGNSVSTEDLRKALQRYRLFFNRLVV